MQNAEPIVFLHNLEGTIYTVARECHLSVCALGQLVALEPTAACLSIETAPSLGSGARPRPYEDWRVL